jgi:hypothetical protein
MCGRQSGTGTRFCLSTSLFPRQYRSINAPYSSWLTCCSYQKEKQAKPGNHPKGNSLAKIEDHWIVKYQFKELICFLRHYKSWLYFPRQMTSLREVYICISFYDIFLCSCADRVLSLKQVNWWRQKDWTKPKLYNKLIRRTNEYVIWGNFLWKAVARKSEGGKWKILLSWIFGKSVVRVCDEVA